MEIIESDVVIIGGGPAGCTCALYTSRSNLKTVILDKHPAGPPPIITTSDSMISNFKNSFLVVVRWVLGYKIFLM